MSDKEVYQLINEIFREIVLCLGGIFLVNKVDDSTIWIIMQSMEELYSASSEKLKHLIEQQPRKNAKQSKNLKPHPAVEKLLHKLKSDSKEI